MNQIVVLVSVMTMAMFGQMASCWDQGMRDYILNIHNDMRRRPGGCEISKLEYDMELERQAQGWANGCQFRHEMKQGRGENLAWNTNKFDDKKLVDIATDGWYDEIKMFSYGQQSCSRSCHYTQLVWGTTNKVGCFAKRCPNLAFAAPNAWYLVCFYTPMGNWSGENPYKKGCASKCKKGQTEDNGLCVGEAAKDPADCKDTNAKCAKWAADSQCEKNPNYMKKKCQKSCNSC